MYQSQVKLKLLADVWSQDLLETAKEQDDNLLEDPGSQDKQVLDLCKHPPKQGRKFLLALLTLLGYATLLDCAVG
jgi:hypothetical protein